jgi:hypothetical protein
MYPNLFSGKSSYRNGKMPEIQLDLTKPSYNSLSRSKWFYGLLVLLHFKIQNEKWAGPSSSAWIE